jgi:hypothetical protein
MNPTSTMAPITTGMTTPLLLDVPLEVPLLVLRVTTTTATTATTSSTRGVMTLLIRAAFRPLSKLRVSWALCAGDS